MRRIREGELRLARRVELDTVLAKKIASVSNPWLHLRIDYSPLGQPNGQRPPSTFSAENDRYLVCLAHQVGYGRWEELQREVRRSALFKFDWFMKTRDQRELGARVETLVKLVEKELDEEVGGEERKTQKGAKAGSKRPLDEEPLASRKR